MTIKDASEINAKPGKKKKKKNVLRRLSGAEWLCVFSWW